MQETFGKSGPMAGGAHGALMEALEAIRSAPRGRAALAASGFARLALRHAAEAGTAGWVPFSSFGEAIAACGPDRAAADIVRRCEQECLETLASSRALAGYPDARGFGSYHAGVLAWLYGQRLAALEEEARAAAAALREAESAGEEGNSGLMSRLAGALRRGNGAAAFRKAAEEARRAADGLAQGPSRDERLAFLGEALQAEARHRNAREFSDPQADGHYAALLEAFREAGASPAAVTAAETGLAAARERVATSFSFR